LAELLVALLSATEMLLELLTALESAVLVRVPAETALESAVEVAPDAADAALVALESAVDVFAEPAVPFDTALESAMDVFLLAIEPIVPSPYKIVSQERPARRHTYTGPATYPTDHRRFVRHERRRS